MSDGLCLNGPNEGKYYLSEGDYFNCPEIGLADVVAITQITDKSETFNIVSYKKKWLRRNSHRWYVWEC